MSMLGTDLTRARLDDIRRRTRHAHLGSEANSRVVGFRWSLRRHHRPEPPAAAA